MYFYLKNGKQFLDLTGDFILTHNDTLIKTRVKSAAPNKSLNAQYIVISKLSFIQKINAVFYIISFIFGRNESLKRKAKT